MDQVELVKLWNCSETASAKLFENVINDAPP